MISEAEYQRAYLAGVSARQNGRKRESCPTWALGHDGELWREQWYRGWDDEDAKRKGAA